MTAAPPVNTDRRRTLIWFAVAIISGLIYPFLGVVGAWLAAWRSPRHRVWLMVVGLVWLLIGTLLLTSPLPWNPGIDLGEGLSSS